MPAIRRLAWWTVLTVSGLLIGWGLGAVGASWGLNGWEMAGAVLAGGLLALTPRLRSRRRS